MFMNNLDDCVFKKMQEHDQNKNHQTPDMFYCTSSSSEARQRHIKEIDPAEADWV